MKRIGHRMVKVSSVKLSGDMRLRQEKAHVRVLADSMGNLGPLQDPVVRHAPNTPDHLRLLAGRDRFAAHMLNQTLEVDVLLVECDDTEAKQIELVENGHRRHSEVEQIHALEELNRLLAASKRALIEETGLEPTKRAVRQRAAEVTHVLPETLERQEARLRAATGQQTRQNGIETWGMELDDEWWSKVQTVTVAMEALATKLTSAFAASKILSERSLVPTYIGQDVRQQLQALSNLVRANIPVALCPYCKGLTGIMEECVPCQMTGWVGREKMKGVPDEFKDIENKRINYRGKMYPIDFAQQFAEPEQTEESVEDFLG